MISCSNYDYIEIVCLFQYPIEITLTSGDCIAGKALDITKNNQGEECIKIQVEKGEQSEQLIVLDLIHKLRILINNPHFTEVVFS